MIVKIIIGVLIGFVGSCVLATFGEKRESSQNILGVIVIVALFFIGSSFAYGAIYGIMAFGEIFIGIFICTLIIGGNDEELPDVAQDVEELSEPTLTEINQVDQDAIREKNAQILERARASVEGAQVDPRIRTAFELTKRDTTRMPDGLSVFHMIAAGTLDEWIKYNKLLDEGVITKDEFTTMVNEFVKK